MATRIFFLFVQYYRSGITFKKRQLASGSVSDFSSDFVRKSETKSDVCNIPGIRFHKNFPRMIFEPILKSLAFIFPPFLD